MAGKKKKTTKFSVRELRFIVEMVSGQNGTNAAIRAGYAASGAATTANRLLNNNKISAEIRRQIELRFADQMMGPKEAIAGLSSIARADVAELVDDDGNPRPLREIPLNVRKAIASFERDGRKRKVRLESKISAYSLIGKFHKLFHDQITITDGSAVADRLSKARARRAVRKKNES